MARLPPALVAAIALRVAIQVVRSILAITAIRAVVGPAYSVGALGVDFTADVLSVAGMFELSRRLVGRDSMAARIGAYAFIANLGLYVFAAAVSLHQTWMLVAYDYVWSALVLACYVPSVIALIDRRPALAASSLVLLAISFVPFLRVIRLLHHGDLAFFLLQSVLRIAAFGSWFAVISTLRCNEPATEKTHAASGFRLAAYAIGLCGVAPAFVTIVEHLGIAAPQTTLLADAIFSAVGPLLVGVSLLLASRVAVFALRRPLLVVAAAASLWVAGVQLSRAVALRSALLEGDELRGDLDLFPRFPALLLGVAFLLVVAAIGRWIVTLSASTLRTPLVVGAVGALVVLVGGVLGPVAPLSGVVTAMIGALAVTWLCAVTARRLETGFETPTARVVEPR